MKIVWLVVVHFTYYGYNIPVLPFQAKAVYSSIEACRVARDGEVAYWASINYPKPVSIACETLPVRR
jgi:hypothetical protein